jgi:hypothetical protein
MGTNIIYICIYIYTCNYYFIYIWGEVGKYMGHVGKYMGNVGKYMGHVGIHHGKNLGTSVRGPSIWLLWPNHWSLQPNLRDHLMNHLIDLLVHMAYGFQQESFKIKCMNLQVLFNQLIIIFNPQRFGSWIVNVSISRCSDHPNRSLDSLNRRTPDCNMDVYENEAPTQPTPMLLAFLLN